MMFSACVCPNKKPPNPLLISVSEDSRRAIDGARTRGLDLGKVARYQLRHYRIFYVFFVPSLSTGIIIPYDQIKVKH